MSKSVFSKTDNNKQQKLSKKNKHTVVINMMLIIAFVAVIAICIVNCTGWGTSTVYALSSYALSTGDYEMDSVTFNYFYRDCYDSFQSAYGDMLMAQGALVNGVSLAEQEFNEENTWAQFFLDVAMGNAKRSMIVYLAAQEAGYELPEDKIAQIDSQINTIEENAKTFGYTDGTQFLQTHYGTIASMDTYREYLMLGALANSFSADYYNGETYSEEEEQAWFESNYPDVVDEYDYYTLDFRQIYIPYNGYEYNEEEGYYSFTEEAIEAALEEAKYIKALYEESDRTEDSFAALASEYSSYNKAEGGLYEDALKDDDGVESQVLNWVFKNSRNNGDVDTVQADSGAYVVYWIGENEPAWKYIADKGLCVDAWNAWYETLEESTQITENQDILNYIYLIA